MSDAQQVFAEFYEGHYDPLGGGAVDPLGGAIDPLGGGINPFGGRGKKSKAPGGLESLWRRFRVAVDESLRFMALNEASRSSVRVVLREPEPETPSKAPDGGCWCEQSERNARAVVAA